MTSDPTTPPPFQCLVKPDRDLVRVCPIGELDIATAGEVQARLDELRQAGLDRLVLDLRRTTFIDSTGLRVVIAWHERSRRERFGFALVQGPDPVRRVFEIAGLSDQLRFLDAE